MTNGLNAKTKKCIDMSTSRTLALPSPPWLARSRKARGRFKPCASEGCGTRGRFFRGSNLFGYLLGGARRTGPHAPPPRVPFFDFVSMISCIRLGVDFRLVLGSVLESFWRSRAAKSVSKVNAKIKSIQWWILFQNGREMMPGSVYNHRSFL